MTVLAQKSGYAFSELFRVTSEGVTPVALMLIPAGTVIERVIVRTETPGTGVANLTVGDDDDADGFVLAGDHTAAAGTVYGDAPTELGVYLRDAVEKAGYRKPYATSTKTLKLVLSAAGTTQGTYQVMVLGHRFDFG